MSSSATVEPTPTSPPAPTMSDTEIKKVAPVLSPPFANALPSAPDLLVKKPVAAPVAAAPATDKPSPGKNAFSTANLDAPSIIRWRSPVVSGTFFALGNFFAYLLFFRGWTLISLVSWILFAEIALCFAYVNLFSVISELVLKRPLKKPNAGGQVFVSQDVIRDHLNALVPVLEVVENTAMNIVLVTDSVLAIKGMGVLLLTAVLGRYFSVLGLLYTAFLAVFTLPVAYDAKKTEIDRALDMAVKKVQSTAALAKKNILDRIPRGADVEKKKQ